ncbi:hypothetical protein E3N88_28138 [Mikania micrantha]|uniref:ARID domain-containing protein n=1 Tax=Mikania micrantha TaxID=192012 RepID=A0A5N6MZV2_9ASTR|nr:hypothetical protein E3N88_28138 [Mikania micrantha]
MHVFCILSVYLISHTHVKTKPSQPFISNIASEPNEPGTCGGPNRAKQLPRSNSVVIEESRKVEVPIVFGSFGDSGEDSGGDRDFSRENQLNMFDRDDQGKEHGDDRENHGECGLENLCKSVTDFKIGTTSRSIGNKGVMAARRFKELVNERKKKPVDDHICSYCNRPGKFRDICKSRILNREFVVYGTENMGWHGTWFVGLERRTHCCAYKGLFNSLKLSHGIETRLTKRNVKAYILGKGKVEISCNGTKLSVKKVYHTPKLGRNVLSMNMLAAQGYKVTITGTMCTITKPNQRKEKVTQDFSVKWYDVNKLSETEIMWNHFEQMEKIKRMKDDGKCKEPIEGPTTKDVKSIEDMVIFLDLLTALNENLLQEEFVKIKFNKMVKWFNKDVIKKGDFWVPIMEEGEVDLYHLYMSVQLNGGKDKVTKNEFWPLLATDMGMNPRKGFELML